MVNDSISDMVCRVRNGCLAKKSIVAMPVTRVNQQIARILEQEGFIQSFFLSMEEFKPTLTLRLKYRSKQFLEKGRYVTSKTSCITNLKNKEQYGDCLVPAIFPEHPQLGIWVKMQRRHFKMYNNGDKQSSKMTLERISKLQNVGFAFNPRKMKS
jgi:hypothetical protein